MDRHRVDHASDMETLLKSGGLIVVALTVLAGVLAVVGLLALSLHLGDSRAFRLSAIRISYFDLFRSGLVLGGLGLVALISARFSRSLFWLLAWPAALCAWIVVIPGLIKTVEPPAQPISPPSDRPVFTRMPDVPLSGESQIRDLIDIASPADIHRIRTDLVSHVWKTETLPTEVMPDTVVRGVAAPFAFVEDCLERTDYVEIELDYGFRAIAYHLVPSGGAEAVVIFHGGHTAEGFVGFLPVIERLLCEGYAVLGMSMPGTYTNHQPRWVNSSFAGPVLIGGHDDYAILESSNFSPIKLFLHPVVVGINWMVAEFHYNKVSMAGVSGGGWTTTLSAAVDSRILQSFPVAGSLPFYLRSVSPQPVNSIGDYEQRTAPLYRLANYLELYVLGASGRGRSQLQILNQFDASCFAGVGALGYAPVVEDLVREAGEGGRYELFLDDSHYEHILSAVALDRVVAELNR